MRSRHLRRATWLLAALCFAACTPAAAQEAIDPPAKAPSAIPAPDVAERADALARELRRLRERIAPDPRVIALGAELPVRSESIAARGATTRAQIAGRPTLAALAKLEREWTRDANELSASRRTLTRRAAALEGELEKLRTDAAIWEATLESTSVSGAPAEVIDAVRQSSAELEKAIEASSTRRREVLALQNRISQQELLATESLESVREARVRLRGRLLEPDQPPLWSAVAATQDTAGERFGEALTASSASISRFLDESRAALPSVGIVFLLAWVAALGLARSVAARRAAGDDVGDTVRVLRRPFSLAALAALLAVFWLFPYAPEELLDAIGALLLVPLLRLVPRLVHHAYRPMLYAVAVFYLVDQLRDLFEVASVLERVVFVLECAVAALFCLSLMRPSRLARIPDLEHFPRWPGRALRLACGLFATAFLANVLGYGSLAKLLGEGMLRSVYLGVAFFAGVRVMSVMLDVTTQTEWAGRIHFLRARRAVALDWMRRGISLLALALWLSAALDAFEVRDPVLEAVTTLLTTPLTLGTAAVSLGDVLAFALTIVVAIGLSRVVRFVLMEDVFSRVSTARGIPHAVSASAHYVILLGGFMLALAAAGIDFSRFALLAGAFGVGIGFGLQNVVNNFVSGLILLYERPVQVGDAIDMGDLIGEVKRIGIRSSTVRTFAGAEVIVPNADLISQRVINWTLSDKIRRIDVAIGVRYGSDPDRVEQILLGVAKAHEKVLHDPAPAVLFRRHGESSLDFEVRVWIADFKDRFVVESALNGAINRALADAGIEIPFPQRDLHVRSVDADAGRALTRPEVRE
jgi:small-conductance mechanosensitive channel